MRFMSKSLRKNKLASTLSIATLVLLKGCSGGDGGSDEPSNDNTAAPELLGDWISDCVAGSNTSTTNRVIAVTSPSGGGNGGGTNTRSGDSSRTEVTFNQNGTATGSVEYFDSVDCNPSLTTGIFFFDVEYTVGSAVIAADGSNAIAINLSDNGSVTYSIFQVVNSFELFLGDELRSSPENDGTSPDRRFDSFGARYNKRL